MADTEDINQLIRELNEDRPSRGLGIAAATLPERAMSAAAAAADGGGAGVPAAGIGRFEGPAEGSLSLS